jgi:hypothetical protein
LVLAISNILESFSERSGLYLISVLLKTMSLDTRFTCSKKLVESSTSVFFALNIYSIIKEEEMQFLGEEIEYLKDVIKNRIKNEMISEIKPVYIKYPCGSFIFRFLQDCNCKDLSKYIEKTFSLDSIYPLKFLKIYYIITADSTHEYKIFEEDNYNSIKRIIDPAILYFALYNTYANILENPNFEDEDSEDIKFLKTFSLIHHRRKQENIQ